MPAYVNDRLAPLHPATHVLDITLGRFGTSAIRPAGVSCVHHVQYKVELVDCRNDSTRVHTIRFIVVVGRLRAGVPLMEHR